LPWIEYLNEPAAGLVKEMASKSENPDLLLSVTEKPPCSQVKGPGKGKELNEGEPLGQVAALAGAAPAKAKVPAAAKRTAPSLKRLFMI
jgi:hypothetical protein